MSEKVFDYIVSSCIASCVATMCCLLLLPSYRQGQIDAINGVIKYELVEQDDGSTKWERKDEE